MAWYQTLLILLLCCIVFGAAQSSSTASSCSAPAGSTYTVSSPAAATSLASCGTYSGDVWLINPSTSSIAYDLTGLQRLSGSLIFENISTGSVFSSTPLNIDEDYVADGTTGQFFANLTIQSAGFFEEIGQSPSHVGPEAYDLSVDINYTLILQNTSRRLAVITLASYPDANPGFVTITDNPSLSEIDISGVINGNIKVAGNNAQPLPNVLPGALVDFGQTTTTSGLEVRDARDIQLTSIKTVNGDLNLTGNSFSVITAYALSSVFGSLIIMDNHNLTDVSLSALGFVRDDLRISSNPMLNDTAYQGGYIYGQNLTFMLPALSTVNRNMEISGSFVAFVFNNLTHVNGDMSLTTDQNMSCTAAATAFTHLTAGHFICKSANDSVSISTEIGKPTSSTLPSNSAVPSSDPAFGSDPVLQPALSPGAEAGIGIGVALAVLACLALGFFIWRMRKSRKRARNGFVWSGQDVKAHEEEPGYEKAELPPSDPRYEMDDGAAYGTSMVHGKQELPAKHGHSEAGLKSAKTSIKDVLVEAPGDESWPASHRKSVSKLTTANPVADKPAVNETAELRTPATPADSSTIDRSSSAVSPVSTAGHGTRVGEGVSPMASPAPRQTHGFSTDETPVSALQDRLHAPSTGHDALSSVAEVPSPAAHEKTTLLSESS